MPTTATETKPEPGVDTAILFYEQLRSWLTAESVVLNVGCGRGAAAEDPCVRLRELQDLRPVAREVVGIDVDAAAAANPTVDRFGLIKSDIWPIAEAPSMSALRIGFWSMWSGRRRSSPRRRAC